MAARHWVEQVGVVQVRLERVWGILHMPVTAKLDWVIKYTGPQAADMFEPALQAFEQAAAAVLERERYHTSILLLAASLSLLITCPLCLTYSALHWPNKTPSGSSLTAQLPVSAHES